MAYRRRYRDHSISKWSFDFEPNGWAARIMGTDPKWGLKREFATRKGGGHQLVKHTIGGYIQVKGCVQLPDGFYAFGRDAMVPVEEAEVKEWAAWVTQHQERRKSPGYYDSLLKPQG